MYNHTIKIQQKDYFCDYKCNLLILESIHNPRIKNLISLQQKSSERKKQEAFVVEGIKEMEMALQSNFELLEIYYCETVFTENYFLEKIALKKRFKITQKLFEKISYRNTGGILAVFKTKNTTLEDLELKENPLIIVLEKIEKPGNLGAVLRTADAVCADVVIVCDPVIDLYNPNVVRSSIGCIFSVSVVKTTSEKAIQWLKNHKIMIYTTYLHKNTVSIYDVDLKRKTAFIMGNEATGVTSKWVDYSDKTIKIPMQGKIDSLNLSNATAVCVYEALRQRLLNNEN
ncbi:MAG: TrmH family RNA methyltransferase [Flavobacteriales bacterium]